MNTMPIPYIPSLKALQDASRQLSVINQMRPEINSLSKQMSQMIRLESNIKSITKSIQMIQAPKWNISSLPLVANTLARQIDSINTVSSILSQINRFQSFHIPSNVMMDFQIRSTLSKYDHLEELVVSTVDTTPQADDAQNFDAIFNPKELFTLKNLTCLISILVAAYNILAFYSDEYRGQCEYLLGAIQALLAIASSWKHSSEK